MPTVDELVENYNNQVKTMQDQMQTAMKDLFKTFFAENPQVKELVWTQYTPYFNDGDECIFLVNDMYYDIKDVNEEEDDDDDCCDEDRYRGSTYKYRNKTNPFEELSTEQFQQLDEQVCAFVTSINKLPDNVFKATFGDHVRVIARSTGFEVQDYEHE